MRQKWVSCYESGNRRLDVIELLRITREIGIAMRDVLDRAGIH